MISSMSIASSLIGASMMNAGPGQAQQGAGVSDPLLAAATGKPEAADDTFAVDQTKSLLDKQIETRLVMNDLEEQMNARGPGEDAGKAAMATLAYYEYADYAEGLADEVEQRNEADAVRAEDAVAASFAEDIEEMIDEDSEADADTVAVDDGAQDRALETQLEEAEEALEALEELGA